MVLPLKNAPPPCAGAAGGSSTTMAATAAAARARYRPGPTVIAWSRRCEQAGLYATPAVQLYNIAHCRGGAAMIGCAPFQGSKVPGTAGHAGEETMTVMTQAKLDVVPLSKHIGAEIRGLDLRDKPDDATVKAIYQ